MNDLQVIGSKIMTLPDRPPFMLDRDLAMVYGTTTKKLNQAVKRNPDRFPEDFIFQLSKSEAESCGFFDAVTDCDRMEEIFKVTDCDRIPSQKFNGDDNAVANCDRIPDSKKRNKRYFPYGFTREGCNMLSAVLTTPTAVARSVQIMRAFSAIERWGGNAAGEIVERLVNVVSKMDEKQVVIEDRLSALESRFSTFAKQAGRKSLPVMAGHNRPLCSLGEQFVSAIEELMRTKRVQIMRNFSEDISISNFTTIGFYKDGDPRYVYLFPKRTMDVLQKFSVEKEDTSFDLSTTAMVKQLIMEGYVIKPQKAACSFLVRIPGGGRKSSPKRVWKVAVKKFQNLN